METNKTNKPIYDSETKKQIKKAYEVKDDNNNIIGIYDYFNIENIKNVLSSLFFKFERVYIRLIESTAPAQNKKKERGKMTKKLRFKVLKRDNYKCVICGATSKTTTLEVDHIIPISKGGFTEMENLQTLCFNCNRGKFNE